MVRVGITHLVKRYGSVNAVDDVSLEVKDKELLCLLGPSGSGKTTTLRCVAGLETPDSGEKSVDGDPINDLSPKERDVAMVFQSYALYPQMSVYDNIAFPLRARKMPKHDIDVAVNKAANLVRIPRLLGRKPKQLSGGEAQRVALARAIVRNPRVFLLDEPLSNLDAKLRLYMRAELKNLQKKLRVTTLYFTHDQAEAMSIADRVVVMDKGKVIQIATPDELYDNPSNEFVANFIGSPPMNMIPCVLRKSNGGLVFETDGLEYVLGPRLLESMKGHDSDSEFILGVRPEDIHLAGGDAPGAIQLQVYEIEPQGSEVIMNLQLGGLIIKLRGSRTDSSPGNKIWAKFDEKKVHVFDKRGVTIC